MERKEGSKIIEELKKNVDRNSMRLGTLARNLGGTSDGIDILNSRINITDFSSIDDLTILGHLIGTFFDEIKNNVLKFKRDMIDPDKFEEYLRGVSGMLEVISILYSESDQSEQFEVVLTDHADYSKNIGQFIDLLKELFSGNTVSVVPGKHGKITLKPEKRPVQNTIHGMGPIDLVQKDSAANPAADISEAASKAAGLYAAIVETGFDHASELASSIPPSEQKAPAESGEHTVAAPIATEAPEVSESGRPSMGSPEVMGQLISLQVAAAARRRSTAPLTTESVRPSQPAAETSASPAEGRPSKPKVVTASYGNARELFATMQQPASQVDEEPTLVEGTVAVDENQPPAIEKRGSPYPYTLPPKALSMHPQAAPAEPAKTPSLPPAAETAEVPADVPLPSDYLTGRTPSKAESTFVAPPQDSVVFTAESNRAAGLPVYTPENPAPETAKLTPEPLPSGTPLPSDYLSGRKPQKSVPPAKPEDNPTAEIPPATLRELVASTKPEPAPASEKAKPALSKPAALKPALSKPETEKMPAPEQTPAQVTGSSRKKLWAALGGLALTVLGGLGIHHFTKSKAHDITQNQPTSTASVSASVASAKPVESAKPQETAPKQAEKVAYKKGMYKVNPASPEYKDLVDYLLDNKLVGLERITRDLSGRVNVLFVEDPNEAAKLRAEGKLVFSGTESQEEVKMKFFEEFLRVSQVEKIDNSWVQHTYLKKHVGEDFHTYKTTGKWPAGSRDSQKYYAAFTNVSQLVEAPGVIGYAVDLDLKRNTALKDMKAAVPSFYHTFVEVNQEMLAGKDPANIPAYDDFNYVKQKVCYRIDQKANAMSGDYRDGLKYMHHQWCNGLPNSPYNFLNQSIRLRVPIKSTEAPKNETSNPENNQAAPQQQQPQKDQIHNNIANPQNSLYDYLKEGLVPRKTRGLNQQVSPDSGNTQTPESTIYQAPAKPPKAHTPKMEPSVVIDPALYREAQPSVIIDPAVYQEAQAVQKPVAAAETKPAKKGLFSRMADKIKSGLGIGKPSQPEQKLAQASQQEMRPTKADLPMDSWKDTLRSYLGV